MFEVAPLTAFSIGRSDFAFTTDTSLESTVPIPFTQQVVLQDQILVHE